MCLSLRPDWAVQEEDRWLLLPLPVTCSQPAASQVEPHPPPPPPPPPPALAVAAWWRDGRVVRMRKTPASARLASPVSSNGVWFGRAFLLKSVV